MFAVVTKSEKMPSSCWGKYRQVAVVELEPGYSADDVTMISDRAKAVRRIVEHWGRLNVGISSRCAYAYPEGATRFAGAYCSLVHFFRYYNS